MQTITNPIPPWARWMLTNDLDDYRYVALWGGRSAGKSWSIARVLAMLAAREPLRILCIREVQRSIEDSSKRLIEDSIQALALSPFFDMQRYATKCANGSEFVYRGLGNVTAETIRSFEAADIAWLEEGHQVSNESWRTLVPTIRKPGSKIIITFNAIRPGDVVYDTFVAGSPPPPRSFVKKLLYTDNPFASRETHEAAEYDRRYNPDIYRHVWLGELAPDIGTLRVLPMAQLGKCVEAFKTYGHLAEEFPADVGLDVADLGEDYNALATRRGPCLLEMQQWRGSESMGDTANRADAHARRIGAVGFYYDAGGIGAGIRSYLRDMGRRPYLIKDVKFGAAPQGPDVTFTVGQTNRQAFALRNAQLAWALKLRVQRTVRLLDGEGVDPRTCLFINPEIATNALLNQLNQPTWDDGDAGKIKIKKADDGERSPDQFDATCLAFGRDSERGLRNL